MNDEQNRSEQKNYKVNITDQPPPREKKPRIKVNPMKVKGISRVYPARTGSTSLKTTIPEEIVNQIGVKDGEQLEWVWEHGEPAVKVKRVK